MNAVNEIFGSRRFFMSFRGRNPGTGDGGLLSGRGISGCGGPDAACFRHRTFCPFTFKENWASRNLAAREHIVIRLRKISKYSYIVQIVSSIVR